MRATKLLAVCSLLAVASCGGAATTDTASLGSDTTAPETTVGTTSTTAADDIEAAEQDALARVHAYFEAVNDRQVDELAEILGVPLSETTRRHFEFHAHLKSYGFTWEVESCEIAATFGSIIKIDCLMHNGNPMFVATGASDVIAPFSVVGGELRYEPWEPLGADFEAPLGAFVDYLTLFTDQYPLCDPAFQTGGFSSHGGIARVPECAEVLVAHMDDMVEWVEAGMPSS